MRNFSNLLCVPAALVLVLFFASSALPQRSGGTVDERNVRAAMTFLAGDAMQGRGSGTPFERIAAEYIGSQFMQFGLEPAGHDGWDGKPGYVQTVTISRNTFAASPTLRAGAVSAEHGKQMLVLRTNAGKVSGPLQKIRFGEKVEPGTAVMVSFPADTAPQAVSQGIQALLSGGAALVMVEETPQHRANWSAIARKPTRE